MTLFLAVGASLLAWFGISFGLTQLIGLTGADAYVIWAVLSVIGIIAAAAFVWWKSRRDAAELPAEGAAETGSDEIDQIVREAEAKLSAAKAAGGAGIGNLPLIFVIGEGGATKTSVVLRSGLEPELLAGQVHQQDNVIAPTRTANLWLAQNAIFAEASAAVSAVPARWVRFIRRLRPKNLKSVVGGNKQAPRAVLLCVNAELFTQAGSADGLAALSRSYGERLGQISQALGISLPVYVLFTRADRLPSFNEFVRTLSNDEASQVLGATLPMRNSTAGIYAEEETRRLTDAFNALFHSLADKRLEFLPRETDTDKVPAAYEFPREFRKLRTPLVQFLVDLCRPSQLRVSPFLRGFYFCGVRPIVVQESAIPAAQPEQRSFQPAGTATGVFQVPQYQGSAAQAAPQYTTSKRVPQWLFLPRLFHNVILQDKPALGASAASTKTSSMQRVLLATGAIVAALLAVVWTVSFLKNRSMVNNAVVAAEGIASAEAAGSNLASVDSLQRLETLRGALEQLTVYRAEGHPMSMSWGLWTGDDLYPHVRAAYYSRFHQLLFRQAQTALVAHLNGLPVAPGPNDDYGLTYDVLKGYLITTTASDKADDKSPAPILLNRWAAGRTPTAEQTQLAEKQFTFYARDLKNGNPFSNTADVPAVGKGRALLSQFSGEERVYQFMLTSASKKSVNYNRDIKDSSQAVSNNRDVPGAFTKDGYAFMQDALRRAASFFGGERWVLCDATGNVPSTTCKSGDLDPAKLTASLSDRYVKDFIAQWRGYFRNSVVLRYADLKDAARKLNLQAGTQSPILALFWLASQHTGVDYTKIPGADRIQKAFQPVHQVVPPGNVDRYVAPSNQPYLNGLVTLQASIDAIANMPTPDPGAVANTLSNATSAKIAVKQVSQGFNLDPEARIEQTVAKLLEDPITNAEALLRSLGPRELNSKGAGMCAQISAVLNKYPFNPASSADASVQDVNSVLKPGEGALWTFYEMNIKRALAKQGTQYVPTGEVPLNPQFVAFFNSMARFSDALYKPGPDPKLTYTVRPIKSEGLQGLVLMIDGQAIPYDTPQQKQFSWPGNGQGAKYVAANLPLLQSDGIWGAFRMFGDSEVFEPSGSGYNLAWPLTLGRSASVSANAPRARLFVDLNGAPPFFRKGTPPLRCVSQVSR